MKVSQFFASGILPLLLLFVLFSKNINADNVEISIENNAGDNNNDNNDNNINGNEQNDNDDDGLPPKRLGQTKTRVGEKVYASYGLSPRAEEPKYRVTEYSAQAVRAASSTAKPSIKLGAKRGKKANDMAEPRAPGAQEKVDLRPYMTPVEDQSQSNSCAANAVAGAYEYLATRAALRDGEEVVGDISRLFIYYVGRKMDQMNWNENPRLAPKDEGMTLKGAMEAVQFKGAALQSSWPFDLSKVNMAPHPEAFQEAMRYKAGDIMSIPLDLDKMRQCLSDGYPIIFGLKLTRNFFYPPYDGFIPTPDPDDPQSAAHGLHAMLIVGYNDRQRVFIIRNSWGSDWGVGGYCYLSYDYVANPEFNFLGMYAIQSLTDDDLTPDEDDGEDLDIAVDPSNTTPLDFDLEQLVINDDGEIVFEDDIDIDDMFDTKAEARRAFVQFAGDRGSMSVDNLLITKEELGEALKYMGHAMVTDEELNFCMKRYDDDNSGYISFDEFLDMQELFDGSLLKRRRLQNRVKRRIEIWTKSVKKLFSSGSSSSSSRSSTSSSSDTTEASESNEL